MSTFDLKLWTFSDTDCPVAEEIPVFITNEEDNIIQTIYIQLLTASGTNVANRYFGTALVPFLNVDAGSAMSIFNSALKQAVRFVNSKFYPSGIADYTIVNYEQVGDTLKVTILFTFLTGSQRIVVLCFQVAT